jgi:hypothetical protein
VSERYPDRTNLRLWMTEEREALLRARLTAHGVDRVSPEGLRCADLVERWVGGLHHFPGHRDVSRVKWSADFVEFATHENLSTYDWSSLTRLVFLGHDLGIRVEVRPCNMRHVKIVLEEHEPREARPVVGRQILVRGELHEVR